MRIAAASLVIACLLCFATSDFAADHESALAETDFTEDAPEESPVENLLAIASRTLANVVALKSYAIAARPTVQKMKLSHAKHGANAILWDFIMEFGKNAPPKAQKPGVAALNRFFSTLNNIKKSKKPSIKNNIILQYSHAMGKLKGKYTKGLGRYVLNHLERAIMASRGVVTFYDANHNLAWGKPKPMMMLNYKALAFDRMPKYLVKMAMPLKKFTTIQHDVTRASVNAETKASAAWLHTGKNQHYRDFIGQAIAKYKETKKAEDHKVYEAALSGAQKSFKQSVKSAKTKSVATNMKHVHVMVPGARNGADAAVKKSTFKFPSAKKLKAEARAAAATWAKKVKAVKPAQQMKDLVAHLEKTAQDAELKKRRAAKEKKAKLDKKKAFAARAQALREKVVNAAKAAWKKQHEATVKKHKAFRKTVKAAHAHAFKVANDPCVTLQSDTKGIVWCNKTATKKPEYGDDVLPLFKKMHFFGHGCCRFTGWKAKSLGYMSPMNCLAACEKHKGCVAADTARPKKKNGKQHFDCFLMLGNKNSIKSLHTQCGKKNKSESCYVKKELPSWAKKRAACKDTPGFVNGNAHDRLSLPAAGHGCDAYAKRWCANGKARPGQQWALGKKYRYPERNCCVCGKRGLQPGWVQKSVRAAAAKKKALKAAAEKAEKAEKAAVEKAAAYASQAAAKKKTAFHTAYASAAAKTKAHAHKGWKGWKTAYAAYASRL